MINSPRYFFIFFLPLAFLMMIYETLSISVYLSSFKEFEGYFYIWIASQAFGSYLLGKLSDRFSKRKILLFSQLSGAIIAFVLFFIDMSNSYSLLTIFALGLFFTPVPVIRAALIDNYPHHSKVQLVAITYMMQFLPWCFFKQFSTIPYELFGGIIVSLIFFNYLVTLTFFSDRKDVSHLFHQKHPANNESLIHKNKKMISFLTLTAMFLAETIFFLSDSFLDSSKNSASFTLIGIGCFTGSVMSLFYRTIPHISILTITYGFATLSSVVVQTAFYVIPEMQNMAGLELLVIGSFGGFYLPFVYDVILSATSSNYRGTACGITETFISLGALCSIGIMKSFKPHTASLMALILFLFLLAWIVQKIAEKYSKSISTRNKTHKNYPLISSLNLKRKITNFLQKEKKTS